jgi:Ankyrin repeats (3 copies)
VQAQRQADGAWQLATRFDVPANAPASGAVRHGNRVIWQLELHEDTQGELIAFDLTMRAAQQSAQALQQPPAQASAGLNAAPEASVQSVDRASNEAWPTADEGERNWHLQEIPALEIGERPADIPRKVAQLAEDTQTWRASFPRNVWRVFAMALVAASVYALLWARSQWHASGSLAALSEGIMGWLIACGLLALSIHAWTKRWHLVVQDASFAVDTSSSLRRRVREFGALQAQPLRLELIYEVQNNRSDENLFFSVVMPGSAGTSKVALTPALPGSTAARALAHHFWQALAHRRMRFAAPHDEKTVAIGPTALQRLSAWLGLLIVSALYFFITALSPQLRWADALQPRILWAQASDQVKRLSPQQIVRSYKRDTLITGHRDGHVQMVEAALASGADPNALNDEGLPLLIQAAGLGQTDIVQTHIKHGADANIRNLADPNKYGDTALLVAFYKGQLSTAQQLLASGADLRAKNRWDWGALHMAAQGECIPCLEWLIQQGFSPNEPAPASRGETPVMLAAGRNKLSTLQWLADHGGDLQQKDPYGHNALGWAEFFKRQETAAWLRTQGLTTEKAEPTWPQSAR